MIQKPGRGPAALAWVRYYSMGQDQGILINSPTNCLPVEKTQVPHRKLGAIMKGGKVKISLFVKSPCRIYNVREIAPKE